MQTKLTLRLDQHLIEEAKRYAETRGKSLSQIVADYFAVLVRESISKDDYPPLIKELKGSLSEAEVDEDDYRDYLADKHQ